MVDKWLINGNRMVVGGWFLSSLGYHLFIDGTSIVLEEQPFVWMTGARIDAETNEGH